MLLGQIKNNRIEESTEVRIPDFGLTRQLQNKNDDSTQKTQSNFGPLKWMAPESIKQKEYSKKSDVYMFGITMWELFYGMEPYVNMNAVEVALSVVTKGNRPEIIDDHQKYRFIDMQDAYQSLMERCWDQRAIKRPLFRQIIFDLHCIESYMYNIKRAP
eukprot:UN05825